MIRGRQLTDFWFGEFDGFAWRKVRVLPHKLIGLLGVSEILVNDHPPAFQLRQYKVSAYDK